MIVYRVSIKKIDYSQLFDVLDSGGAFDILYPIYVDTGDLSKSDIDILKYNGYINRIPFYFVDILSNRSNDYSLIKKIRQEVIWKVRNDKICLLIDGDI